MRSDPEKQLPAAVSQPNYSISGPRPGGQPRHAALLDALHCCQASVVLSGYASPLYDDHLSGWSRMQLATFTGNGRADEQNRTEVLWSNRLLGEPTLFDEIAS